MNINLIITSLGFCIGVGLVLFYFIAKEKISVKYSTPWFILLLFLIIITLVPNLLTLLSELFGFVTPANMVQTLLIGVLLLICIALTVIVTTTDKKIRQLVQEISLLKSKIDK